MRKLYLLVFFFAFLGLHARAYELSPEIMATGLRTVVVNTVGAEEPVCESIQAPQGSWGVGITNVNKVPGSVTVLDADGLQIYHSGEYEKKESGMTIKVRGNTSARYDKKPFKIKLEKKGDLMGRGDKSLNDKNWVLLARFDNLYELGFRIGDWIGMPWAPAFEYVHLVMNGDYRGVYLLAEAVERNEKCRIVTEETGFVTERDAYWWNENGEYLPSGWNPQFNWTMKYPDFEDLTEENKDYITGVLHDFEAIIKTGDYESLIDIDSFCKWLLAQDILGTSDGGGTNFYIAKNDDTPSSLLYVPVLWDVDSGEETEDAWSNVHFEGMIAPLWNNSNTRFVSRYVQLYHELSPGVWDNVGSLTSEMRGSAWQGYNLAVEMNNRRWEGNGAQNTSAQNARDMERWFTSRKGWMDNAIAELEGKLAQSEVGKVGEDSFIDVYTLDGVKVYAGQREEFAPSSSGIYITHSAQGVSKVFTPRY